MIEMEFKTFVIVILLVIMAMETLLIFVLMSFRSAPSSTVVVAPSTDSGGSGCGGILIGLIMVGIALTIFIMLIAAG
ncbi:MAG: hypothetical protein KBF17_07855 [Candidatus Promineofilum sp.]|nr:hypothetical protein [Promineifilum sp.]